MKQNLRIANKVPKQTSDVMERKIWTKIKVMQLYTFLGYYRNEIKPDFDANGTAKPMFSKWISPGSLISPFARTK